MPLRTIHTNIAGRVKKVKTKDFLVALFEAVSNSIHSIESAGNGRGRIVIELLRQPRQFTTEDIDRDPPITGFVIMDNGVGFTDRNTESFCEADSLLKEHLGGKGVGRFSWLKFFERATIESVFEDGTTRFRRGLTFTTKGVEENLPVEAKADLGTTVKLSPLHVVFEPKACKSIEQIAIEIIEHFIAYLVTGSMPPTKIIDGAASEEVVDLYTRSIGRHSLTSRFMINGHAFEATGIRFFLSNQTHTVFLCGNKRAAEKVVIGKRDPFFARKFVDEDLRYYALHLFVQSTYLDGVVNDDRDGFMFPELGSLEAHSKTGVTKEEVLDHAIKCAREQMSAEIEKIRATNIATVASFVSSDAPQYRHLVTRHAEAVSVIHETDKVKIDQALRRLQFEEELKTKDEVAALLRKAEEVGESAKEEWRKKSAEVLSKLNEEGKANLAIYIVQRGLILDLLQRRMDVTDGGHAREEAIHQLIFPMRTTSDDVNYEDQNLWIIDERLSYHYYLASDKPLHSIPPAESGSRKEPDVIVFNRPIALNDRPENERMEAITIIEFKRPGESSVDGHKNPVDQVLEYIELITAGRASTRKGRPIVSTEAMYFFGYVVCELDPLLKKVLLRRTMHETPDGRGMFGFFPAHKAYVEVISYEKMLDNARKRNRILFDKLHLPHH
jgi:hypothetical protein